MYYQNVRGLRTKLVSLRCSVPSFLNYDILVLTETWLTPDIDDSELGFTGYQLFRLDRNSENSPHSRGGGVLLAVKSALNPQPITTNVNNVEQIFVLLSLNSVPIIIGSIYLPPSTPLAIIESHLSCINHLMSFIKPQTIILCGYII